LSELSEIAIVGASLAGLRAAEALRAEGYAGRLTIVGSEQHLPYDRPPLSKELLTGAMERAELDLPHPEGLDATWRLGSAATKLDLDARALTLADGSTVAFDGLVLATGSGARVLPTFPHDSETVHTLRTADDAHGLRGALRKGVRLLIVGCGFIGVEVAASARALGAEVTAIGLEPPLAPAGPLASAAATRLLETAGVTLHIGHGVSSTQQAADGAHRVVLSDGTELEADQVVVSVGSVPNVGWLEGSGLEIADGVVCDVSLHAVGATDVVAAGDIARWPNATYGGLSMRVEHWSNAIEQGNFAARSLLLGTQAPAFGSVPSFWSDHFGIRLQSVGLPKLADRFELVAGSPEEGRFAAAAYAGETLVGAISYGMPRALVAAKAKLMKEGVELEAAGA
jgi:NADPH-dependent 2,4-dienoyl-CoA reductase/sulfur reductase-like enzyme